MKWFTKLCAAAILSLLLPGIAAAEWKMPNLNPFSTSKTPPRSAVGNQGDSGWGWWPGNQQQKSTSLWPTRPQGNPSIWPQNSQSTWTRMTNGTKQAFAKTADFLNPFDDANDRPSYNPTGSQGIKSSSPKTADKTPWYAPFPNPEPERPKTVTDFLKQTRPGFND
jgi:hypothetical protein